MSETVLAFNVMGPEMIWIVALLLLLFGAKKLPQLARGIGESIGEFKKARKEFEDEVAIGEKSAAEPSAKPKELSEGKASPATAAAAATGQKDHA